MELRIERGRRTATKSRLLGAAVLLVPILGWGCVDSDPGGPGLGDPCTSSLGEPGEISAMCGSDDAFCESTDNGSVCFGFRPFTCPEGQVRTGWSTCGYPSDGTGGEGSDGDVGVGDACSSSQNEPGTIVADQGGCLQDDAFCEAMESGTYCTGSRPFVCPDGQVRVSWTSCGFPDVDEGLGGWGGAGGFGGSR